MENEVDFLFANKRKCFLQHDRITQSCFFCWQIGVKGFFKLILSF